jgi:uncharacterized membrane protein YraQ (UPF0718 family)
MMITRILKELFQMIWEIFWPLALGFILSALTRAFVSTSSISSGLGKSDAKGITMASLFGAVSSSCSYAAASIGRTLIMKGSSWINAIVFMIASTNLVFEIFLVIVTLLGWAFFGGEIIGGILFILTGAILLKWLLPEKTILKAKKHMRESETSFLKKNSHAHHGMDSGEDLGTMEGMDQNIPGNKQASLKHERHHPHPEKISQNGFVSRLKTAAGYFHMDVTMVGKDIAVGIIVSAVLAVVVPPTFWQSLFLKNGSNLPAVIILLWNVIVGIIVAVFAFVCSVGNILLGAVLWNGGISFGGVIAFILSDLVTIPMLLVYRRYYGTPMMMRLFLILSLSILVTGVGVDYIFQLMGLIPQHHGSMLTLQMEPIQWNYKTILNLIFMPISGMCFFWGKSVMKKGMRH